MINIFFVIDTVTESVKSSLQLMNVNTLHIFMIHFRRIFFMHMIGKRIKMVNSSPRVPFVTQDSRFVSENLFLQTRFPFCK